MLGSNTYPLIPYFAVFALFVFIFSIVTIYLYKKKPLLAAKCSAWFLIFIISLTLLSVIVCAFLLGKLIFSVLTFGN